MTKHFGNRTLYFDIIAFYRVQKAIPLGSGQRYRFQRTGSRADDSAPQPVINSLEISELSFCASLFFPPTAPPYY